MKLLSQHGFGDGEKSLTGIENKYIDGIIYSPKDYSPKQVNNSIEKILNIDAKASFYIDPQFYISLYALNDGIKLGKLTEWNCFKPYRRNDLENPDILQNIIKGYLKYESKFPVSALISPNIYITRSFDSIEASIAKNFIRYTKEVYNAINISNKPPVFASLVLSREALINKEEFFSFVNDLTSIENPPDGYYIIIGSRSLQSLSDIFDADVIANWMFLNYALRNNGFIIINGFADILSPLLGIAGANACSTGWWSNLRMFSLDKFMPKQEKGRLPVIKYLSAKLLNRITIPEKSAFSSFEKSVINDLYCDALYDPEPKRAEEVLQCWETISFLSNKFISQDIKKSCLDFLEHVKQAKSTYQMLERRLITTDYKFNYEYLDSLELAIDTFIKIAEL